MNAQTGGTAEVVGTPAGEARITWHHAKKAHTVLALGHGAAWRHRGP